MENSWLHNKDIRRFLASAAIIVLVVALLLYLTFIPVPQGNKDIIVTIISVIVGGLSVSINTMLGKSDDEIIVLKDALSRSQNESEKCFAKYHELKAAFDDMQERLVDNIDLKFKEKK
jgi:predicted PurR-regulated permease PerM